MVDYLQIVKWGDDLVNRYKAEKKRYIPLMRGILREMRLNLERIDDYVEKGNPIKEVIMSLENKYLTEAILKTSFDFKDYQKKPVGHYKSLDEPFYHMYQGWETERLFSSIEEKITRLQEITQKYGDNPKYDLNKRLLYIKKLIILLFVHLRRK